MNTCVLTFYAKFKVFLIDIERRYKLRIENTHEPLITQDTWDAVQQLDNHPARHRSGKSGTISLFSGLLRCSDCGASMRYMRDYRKKMSGKEPEFKSYVCNRYASGGKNACSSHYINQKVLEQVVLLDIRIKAMLAQNNPESLKEKIRKQKQSADAEQLQSLQATLTAVEKRLKELEKLVVSTYEDKVKGAIPEAICVQLMRRYEEERLDKLEQKTELIAKAEALKQTETEADDWIDMIRDYTKLETLDRPTLMRMINKIEISERKIVDGRDERERLKFIITLSGT